MFGLKQGLERVLGEEVSEKKNSPTFVKVSEIHLQHTPEDHQGLPIFWKPQEDLFLLLTQTN